MALSNTQIQKAKPDTKNYRLYDEKGLYIEVTPAGGKLWRLKYRFGGKEKRLALGAYPAISLKAAREARDSARALLANQIDPGEHKKTQRAAQVTHAEDTFEAIAREWHAGKSRAWSAIHAKNVMARLERNVFPWIGKRAIRDITVPEILKLLRRVEGRGAHETAHRVVGNCSEVYRYAIAAGKAERNIVLDLRGALQPVVKTHLAAITEPRRVGELLKMIDGYQGTPTVEAALKLAPLVFVRPGSCAPPNGMRLISIMLSGGSRSRKHKLSTLCRWPLRRWHSLNHCIRSLVAGNTFSRVLAILDGL